MSSPGPAGSPSPPGAQGMPPPNQIPVPITERAHHLQRVFVGVTVPFLVLMLVALGLRLSKKGRKDGSFGYDDAFIIAGVICAIATWSLCMAMNFYQVSFQTPAVTLATVMVVMKIAIPAIIFWAWSLSLIKISVVFMLLRFEHKRPFRVFLWLMVLVQILFGLYNTLFILLRCRPMHHQWDFSAPERCLSNERVRISSIISSIVNVATDLILSLTPLNFIMTLKRSMSEKVLLFALMAIGILASSASIIKSVVIGTWAKADSLKTKDSFSESIVLVIWVCLEIFLAATAACAPFLKAPLQTFLSLVGINFTVDVVLATAKTQHSGENTSSADKSADGLDSWTSQGKSEADTDGT